MKKIYIKPTVEIEITEAGELMTGSGNAVANYGNEVYDQPIDAVDGDESDAKMGGTFACWEDDAAWEI